MDRDITPGAVLEVSHKRKGLYLITSWSMDFSSIFWFNLMIFQNWGGELKMLIKTFKKSTNHLVKNKRKANGFIYFEPIFSS